MEKLDGKAPKLPWQPPKIMMVASLHDIVRGGGGKLSTTGGDPGESRKEKPH